MFLQILGYSTTKQKKGCTYSAYRLKYIDEVESKRKRKNVFSHCRVHIRYLVFWLLVPKEYLLLSSIEIILGQGI